MHDQAAIPEMQADCPITSSYPDVVHHGVSTATNIVLS
jgi:hypothetical protein